MNNFRVQLGPTLSGGKIWVDGAPIRLGISEFHMSSEVNEITEVTLVVPGVTWDAEFEGNTTVFVQVGTVRGSGSTIQHALRDVIEQYDIADRNGGFSGSAE